MNVFTVPRRIVITISLCLLRAMLFIDHVTKGMVITSKRKVVLFCSASSQSLVICRHVWQ
jgi:hypothetical protein